MNVDRPAPEMLIAGRYRLRGEIGRGSMGEIWLADHARLGSPVAVKVLRPKAMQDPWIVERLFDEARILASLDTRHVVRVFDFGTTDSGLPFVVMEYLDGETLAARLARCGHLSPSAALRLLSDAARGLNRAHSAGIVHRDFKPANLFLVLDEDGTPCAKVIDFGVAKRVGSIDESARASLRLSLGASAPTLPRPILPGDREETDDRMPGTLVYMAPEQFGVARTATAESDQWAFAVVAYECLTGVLPFARRPLDDFAVAIRRGEFFPPTRLNPELPKAIDAWMSKALSVDPSRRFPNMLVCAEALREALLVETRQASLRPAASIQDGARASRAVKTIAAAAACAAITLAGVPSAWLVGARDAASAKAALASGEPMATMLGPRDCASAVPLAAAPRSEPSEPSRVTAPASKAHENEPIAHARSERQARRGSTAYRNDPY